MKLPEQQMPNVAFSAYLCHKIIKMEKYCCILLIVTALLSCKKEDDNMPIQQLSNKMVIVATDTIHTVPLTTFVYYAMISDFQGNVLDFAEVVPGTTTTLTTGDENILNFDYHFVSKAMGQYESTNVTSYHNVTGDTIHLGSVPSSGSGFIKLHSELTVTGLPQYPQEHIFGSNGSSMQISVGNHQMKCEIYALDLYPQPLYLCYGIPGEDKYRYYWNKNVGWGSDIMVTHDELPQIPPFQTMTFPSDVTLDRFYVSGIPNEGQKRLFLASNSTGGTGDIPVYLPANFATDLWMNIYAVKGDDQIQTDIKFDDHLPDQYTPPSMSLSLDNDPGVGFNVTGNGFDDYDIGFKGKGLSNSGWVVKGPAEPEMSFKYPILSDSIKALIQIEPAELEAVPFKEILTKYSPTISFQLVLPNKDRPFVRRDIVTKL